MIEMLKNFFNDAYYLKGVKHEWIPSPFQMLLRSAWMYVVGPIIYLAMAYFGSVYSYRAYLDNSVFIESGVNTYAVIENVGAEKTCRHTGGKKTRRRTISFDCWDIQLGVEGIPYTVYVENSRENQLGKRIEVTYVRVDGRYAFQFGHLQGNWKRLYTSAEFIGAALIAGIGAFCLIFWHLLVRKHKDRYALFKEYWKSRGAL